MCATGWARRKPPGCSCSWTAPPPLAWRRAATWSSSDVTSTAIIQQLPEEGAAGGRVDRAEALRLYREAPTMLLGWLADGIRARKHPSRTGRHIIDRNVKYTN